MGISVLLPGSKRRARRAARSAPAATLAVDSSPGKGAVVEVSVTAAKEAPKLRPAIDVVAGGLARAMSQTTIHPLDTLKVRMQAPAGKWAQTIELGQLTAREKAVGMGKNFKGLYRGVTSAATGAGIAIGAYFFFYGAATTVLHEHTVLEGPGLAFWAGALGAVGGSVVKVPLAVCIRSVQAGRYPNAMHAARHIVRRTGPRGLFTGFLPTLIEDVPDMAVKFAAYELLREVHAKVMGTRGEANVADDLVIGGVAGAVAAAATTPLDVIKTNMMTTAAKRPTMTGAARAVWAEGGGKAFFRGIGPRAISNGINSAVVRGENCLNPKP